MLYKVVRTVDETLVSDHFKKSNLLKRFSCSAVCFETGFNTKFKYFIYLFENGALDDSLHRG